MVKVNVNIIFWRLKVTTTSKGNKKEISSSEFFSRHFSAMPQREHMHDITVLFNVHLDNDYDPYTATFLKQCLTAVQDWNERNKGKKSNFF